MIGRLEYCRHQIGSEFCVSCDDTFELRHLYFSIFMPEGLCPRATGYFTRYDSRTFNRKNRWRVDVFTPGDHVCAKLETGNSSLSREMPIARLGVYWPSFRADIQTGRFQKGRGVRFGVLGLS